MTRCKNVDHCKGTHPTICEQEGCAREAGELRRQADFNQASAEKYIEYLEADNKAARAQLAAMEQELEKEKAQSRHLAEAVSRKIDELIAAENQCSYYRMQYTRTEKVRKEACEANAKAQAKTLWLERSASGCGRRCVPSAATIGTA